MTDTDEQSGPMVLPFELEGERYCVDVDRVRSVLGVDREAVPADATDPWYAGEFTTDGTRVRVVDLGRVVGSGTPARSADPKLVVFTSTDADGSRYGWLVDAVGSPSAVAPSTLEKTVGHSRFVRGRVDLDRQAGRERALWLDAKRINE
ncbi:chemotaxis protein CheW [Natrialbaceae archaeon AArc-T1-2]|uniref:chemotaxis protein CheW n=1 Tax=Natrialbaceae archaeon AArc-T1-2 TaxID=3053904 RepID=UPI00255AEEAE|nr:chemotaxis protein CheW [Natrialbaceae archaeon AArc-T1-2]WIV67928.1 chemotaxis protein CheW [Natrialbaceae archaeon AArc-T1-2]